MYSILYTNACIPNTCILHLPPASISASTLDPNFIQHQTTSSNTMATNWYCCECNFGPHNSDLYVACINCSKRRCSRCLVEKAVDSLTTHNHAHCHETSPYPSVASIDTVRPLSFMKMPTIPTPDLPGIRPLYRPGPAALVTPLGTTTSYYTQTFMYICCQCNDGPKVYNVQPVCVECNHAACSSCAHVK